MRTDENNNPAALTTDVAKQAGLIEGVDYIQGTPFKSFNHVYYTAKFLKDPVDLTIKVIDKIGFMTNNGLHPRWEYTSDLIKKMWGMLSYPQKILIIADMYKHEGGSQPFSDFIGHHYNEKPTEINIKIGDELNLEEKLG